MTTNKQTPLEIFNQLKNRVDTVMAASNLQELEDCASFFIGQVTFGKPAPCPICSCGKDRFQFSKIEDFRGSYTCRQCKHEKGYAAGGDLPRLISLCLNINQYQAYKTIGRYFSISHPNSVSDLSEKTQRRKKIMSSLDAAKEQKIADKQTVAEKAQRIWKMSEPATSHPYLSSKSIQSHGTRIDRYQQLLIPLSTVEGTITTLERILPTGEKRPMAGGVKKGSFFTLGHIDPQGEIGIAEGFSTAASIREAMGCNMLAVMGRFNLSPVAQAIRAHYPTIEITFYADNDRKHSNGLNPGLQDAMSAAAQVGAWVCKPWLIGDFNDVYRRNGSATVKHQTELKMWFGKLEVSA